MTTEAKGITQSRVHLQPHLKVFIQHNLFRKHCSICSEWTMTKMRRRFSLDIRSFEGQIVVGCILCEETSLCFRIDFSLNHNMIP